MIDVHELRIGNWVQAPLGESMKVDVIGDLQNPNYIHAVLDGGFGQNGFFGIPLTPEILERILTKVNDKEFKIEIPVEWSETHHTDYWFYVKLYEYYATGESHVGWRPYIKEGKDAEVKEIFLWGYLKTLHQLQNLYYALTNSELTITL